MTRDYDGTIARIAGNIAGRVVADTPRLDASREEYYRHIAEASVALARAIVDEVRRTEPSRDVVQ